MQTTSINRCKIFYIWWSEKFAFDLMLCTRRGAAESRGRVFISSMPEQRENDAKGRCAAQKIGYIMWVVHVFCILDSFKTSDGKCTVSIIVKLDLYEWMLE